VVRAQPPMRCPECKSPCPRGASSCDHCGASLARPHPASSPLANLSGLACVGVLLFKFLAAPGAAREAAPPPPPPPATPRGTGPTLNGVPYDKSPYVHTLDLTRPAPPAPRR
jgi:hypothetical protein